MLWEPAQTFIKIRQIEYPARNVASEIHQQLVNAIVK